MGALRGILLALVMASVAFSGPNSGTFRNPILAGCYPDPSVCRVGDDYYLVHSTFEYFPGVPIFHSQDLVHWRQIGHCLTRASQVPLEKMRASGGIFAPTLRHHDGKFYMVTTNVWGGGNFYVTATDPAGPWSEPVWLDQQGMDPSLFFDDDGTAYYVRHVGGADGHIGMCKIDLAAGKLDGELKKIWGGTGGVWAEGPHLYKVKGRYYLMISEGGTSYDHKVTIARSDSPWGPYEACPNNPIMTHAGRPAEPIQATGHADLVETPSGWWAVCLGIRPHGGKFHHLGRETFLAPVTWSDNGWPVIGEKGMISLEMPAPKLASHPWPAVAARDEFDARELSSVWNFLRNPRPRDWSLSERPGYLRLHGSAVTLNDQDSPAFVGRRQGFLSGTASAKVAFDPRREGDEAGLVLRGNDKNHVEIGVAHKSGKRCAFLRRTTDGKVVGEVEYFEIPAGDVALSVEATPLEYELKYQAGTGPAVSLGSVPTQSLSSEKIGGFTGVFFGMYATGNGQASESPADFDWFEYQSRDPQN